jgi:DNA-binding transcriptional LysR family regulator
MNITKSGKMDWSILRDFIAVSETGGLSQAARRLRVSQPTLSRRIAQLETQLKAQLFQRTRAAWKKKRWPSNARPMPRSRR